MQPTQPTNYVIGDLYEWYKRQTLILQPKFQRRAVWSPTAKSYLIDTILRNLPVPKLYIRTMVDLNSGRTIREVVDGQQRLKAVFDYIEERLTVSKIHNEQYHGRKFTELPEVVRKSFLSYPLSTDLLLGASDREVLDIFTRINSYTITLNRQEKLNAKFSGAFKQTVYSLGLDHLEFWKNNLILTDQGIARMDEAELASELMIAMLDGLQPGKTTLSEFYEKYDPEFPQAKEYSKRLHEMINLIAFVFGDKLSKTPFKRAPLFYSLFGVFYDCRYGLPKMEKGRILVNDKTKRPILQSLLKLGEVINAKEIPDQYEEFVLACKRSTDKLKERQIRHNFIWDAVHSAVQKKVP